MSSPQVGFAGLGSMGLPMAANLHKALAAQDGNGGNFHKQLLVWNRTASKGQSLCDAGAAQVAEVADLAAQCQVVFTSMVNDAALRQVFGAYLAAPKRPAGSIFIDTSTVAPALTAELAAQAKEHGIGYLSCPVVGRPDAAAAKQLIMMPAGDPELKRQVNFCLEAMGRMVLDVGDEARLGSVMKLTANFFIVSFIEVISEGMALGEKNGLTREVVQHLWSTMVGGKIPSGYGERIAASQFELSPSIPGFPVSTAMKDVGHMVQLAKDSGAALPSAENTQAHLKELADSGRGDLDWGAIGLLMREKAGLPS